MRSAGEAKKLVGEALDHGLHCLELLLFRVHLAHVVPAHVLRPACGMMSLGSPK